MGGETRDKTPVTRTAEARSTSGRNNESLNKVHKGKGVAEDTAEETGDDIDNVIDVRLDWLQQAGRIKKKPQPQLGAGRIKKKPLHVTLKSKGMFISHVNVFIY